MTDEWNISLESLTKKLQSDAFAYKWMYTQQQIALSFQADILTKASLCIGFIAATISAISAIASYNESWLLGLVAFLVYSVTSIDGYLKTQNIENQVERLKSSSISCDTIYTNIDIELAKETKQRKAALRFYDSNSQMLRMIVQQSIVIEKEIITAFAKKAAEMKWSIPKNFDSENTVEQVTISPPMTNLTVLYSNGELEYEFERNKRLENTINGAFNQTALNER